MASGRPAAAGPGKGGRLALCALVAAAAAACSGCTQLLSIGETGVVVGLGVDAGPGGEVTATADLYHYPNPGGGGGGPSSSPLQPVQVFLQGSGPDLAAAVTAIQAQTDVFVDLWSTSALLLGEALAERDVRPALDDLLRSGRFALPTQVAVVEGAAGALLGEASIPGGPSVDISQRLVRAEATDIGSIPIPFWQFMSRVLTPYRAAWAPVVAATAQGYRATGTAVFQGGRLAGMLDPQQTEALGWLLKLGGFPPLSFTRPDGTLVTLRVIGRRRRIAAEGPGVGVVDVTLNTTPQDAPGLQLLSPQNIQTVEDEAQVAATADLRAMLDRLQSSGSDVLGFGERVRERDPGAVGQDWPSVFARMRIQIEATVRVEPSGRLA